MRIWHYSLIAFLLGAIFILGTRVTTAGFQKPSNWTSGIPLSIAGRPEAGSVVGETPEARPREQHQLFLPLVMKSSASGSSVPVQVHAVFDDGSGNPGASIGAGAIIRVDGVEKGITDASSTVTIPMLPGSHTLEAVLPSLAIGQQTITVTSGQSNNVTVLLNGNGEVIEPSQLVIDELVNGGLSLNTSTITLRFLKNGATVPVTQLWDVELGTQGPNSLPVSVTDLFQVTSSGTVAATDVSQVNSMLQTLASDAVIQVIASDARGLSYAEEVDLAPGLYAVNGQLAAPPSQPALPLGGIILQATFGNGITKTVTSNSNGTFSLPQVPGGILHLSGATTFAGMGYSALAFVSVDGDQNLLIRALGLTDIRANVVPWEITPVPSAGVTQPAPKQISARTQREATNAATPSHPFSKCYVIKQPQREAANAATPSHFAVPRGEGDVAIVQSSAQNIPVSDSATILVPKETQTVILKYLVASSEYPGLESVRSGCNDTWTLWVVTSSGEILFAMDRTVKSQLSSPPTWTLDGSTGFIQQEIDVAKLTTKADIELTVYATATNIGDSSLETTVYAELSLLKTITIDTIEKDVVNPTRGESDRYSIPRPGATNHFQRHFDVTFTKPNDVTLTNVKVELMANGAVLQKVVDGPPGSPGIELLDPKTLRIDVTFGHTSSAVASTPPPADRILYHFTLKGQAMSGADIQSDPKESPQFFALWRMPDNLPRYGQYPPDEGLDDWAAQSTYTWLDSNRTLVTAINDISGEHARDLHHLTHYEGKDIDMFHVYTFPGAGCGQSGTQNYICLRENVQAALGGDKTAKTNVTAWATQTRARFDLLLADTNVRQIYYAIGSVVTTTAPSLGGGWASQLLRFGSYTDPNNDVLNLGIGTWTNANNAHISYNEDHNNHFHVALY